MAKYFLIASLAVSTVMCQDRYWGSYSASYPAGGSGSSADVAYDVANLQEASRQSLIGAQRAPASRAQQASVPKAAFAPQQQQSFGSNNQASRPGGYTHNPTGDTGSAYVHDTTGDHGPYYYWKLRQQAKNGVAAPAPAAPAPTPAPQRQVVTVRKQRPAPIQPAFANFQARPTAQAAPARQQYFQPAPAPVRQAPAPVRQAPAQNYFQAQAPEYQNNFAQRAYAYTAPTYSAQAQGVSFSYEATFGK